MPTFRQIFRLEVGFLTERVDDTDDMQHGLQVYTVAARQGYIASLVLAETHSMEQSRDMMTT